MILRAFFYAIIGICVIGCVSTEDANLPVNTPEYNMLLADEMTSAIWSVDILELLDNSTIDKLDLGMAGMVVQGLMKKMIDTAEGGVDFSNNSYISFKHDTAFSFDYSFTTYPVTNRSKVFKTLKSTIGFVASGNQSVYEGFDAYTSNTGVAALWDDKHVVLVFNQLSRDKQNTLRLAKSILDKRYVDAPENNDIREFLALKDDFNCYIDLERMGQLGDTENDMKIFQDLIRPNKDGILIARGNFSKGEMVFSMDVNVDNLEVSTFNVFQNEGVSQEMLRSVATNQSINVWGANLKVDNLLKAMSAFEFGGNNILGVLNDFGFSEASLGQLLTGEVALSMVDIDFKEEDGAFDFFDEESYTELLLGEDLNPELLISLKLKNPDRFKGFLLNAESLKNNGEVYTVNGFYILERSGNAIITMDEEMAHKIADGKMVRDNDSKLDEMRDGVSFYGYFNTDYTKYTPSVLSMLRHQLTQDGIDKLWMAEKITASGNYNHIEFKVVMKDKEVNALGTFVQSIYGLILG